MTKTYFEEMMGAFGCHCVDGVAFGSSGNYPYSAVLQNSGEPPELIFRFLLAGQQKAVVSHLKQYDHSYIRWFSETRQEGYVLVGIIRPPSDFYVKAEIHSLLSDLPTVLEKTGATAPDLCPLCSLGNCDSYAYLLGSYRATHAACLQNKLELPELDIPAKTTVRGNYVTGILGAVLGAMVAVAPNWAQALSNGRILSVLYAFIPILSALLYRLFRGRASRTFSALTVLLASLSVAFMLELFWYWLAVSQNFTLDVSWFQSVQLYLQNHTFSSSIKEMLFSLVFLLAGYFAATVLLRRYADSGVLRIPATRGSRFVMASISPISDSKLKKKSPPPQGGLSDESSST